MNLEKLTPAPWAASDEGDGHWCVLDATGKYVDGLKRLPEQLAKRIALWRNAEDVMMRRGWKPSRDGHAGTWYVSNHQMIDATVPLQGTDGYPKRFYADPFTSLVEADRWYRENVEK